MHYNDGRLSTSLLAVALICLAGILTPALAQAAEKSGESADAAPGGPMAIAVQKPVFADHLEATAPTHFDQATFTVTLEQSIRGTRKFDVVTRDKAKLEVIQGEQAFAASPESLGNAAAQGFLFAIDYIAFPTVTLFEFGAHHRPVPRLENRFHRREAGRLEVQIDVMETDTGRMIGSFTFEDSFASKEKVVSGKGGPPSSSRFVAMAKAIGDSLADQLLKTAYPILVINTWKTGDPIYLNRGMEGGLKEGDVLHLFNAGEPLIDPQTGEDLGTAEEFVSQIKIVGVRPKTATAELIDMAVEPSRDNLQIVRGDIARLP